MITMKQFNINYTMFCVSIFFSIVSQAGSTEPQPIQLGGTTSSTASLVNEYTIPLVIIIDGGTSKEETLASYGNRGALSGFLEKAIECNIPILVSTSLLFARMLYESTPPEKPYDFLDEAIKEDWVNLTKKRAFKTNIVPRLSDDQQWRVYLNYERDLALLIPKDIPSNYLGNEAHKSQEDTAKYITEFQKLYALGFESNNLSPIEPTLIRSTFTNRAMRSTPFNLNHFKKMFRQGINASGKNIVLTGHGTYLRGGLVANISMKDYKELIHFFDTINTKFLLVQSCFSGGANSLIGHHNLQDATYANVNYPIVLGSTIDTPQSGFRSSALLRDFFTKIGSWQREPLKGLHHLFLGKAKGQQTSLIDILKTYRFYDPLSIESILFPGGRLFFRTIATSEDFVLTYQGLQRFLLEPKLGIQHSKNALVLDKPRSILIYPSIINCDIVIEEKLERDNRLFYSKIPGNGCHFIDNIHLFLSDIPDIFKLFFDINQPDSKQGSNYGWFIQHYVTYNSQASFGLPQEKLALAGLTILNGIYKDIVTFKLLNNNTYYLWAQTGNEGTSDEYALKKIIDLNAKSGSNNEIIFRPIHEEEYYTIVNAIFTASQPTQEALNAATAGNEIVEHIKLRFNDYINTILQAKFMDDFPYLTHDTAKIQPQLEGSDKEKYLGLNALCRLKEINDLDAQSLQEKAHEALRYLITRTNISTSSLAPFVSKLFGKSAATTMAGYIMATPDGERGLSLATELIESFTSEESEKNDPLVLEALAKTVAYIHNNAQTIPKEASRSFLHSLINYGFGNFLSTLLPESEFHDLLASH